jgi:mRNA interferase YafQ
MSRSGRYDMHLLKEVMGLLIANDAPLPIEWLDESLQHSF